MAALISSLVGSPANNRAPGARAFRMEVLKVFVSLLAIMLAATSATRLLGCIARKVGIAEARGVQLLQPKMSMSTISLAGRPLKDCNTSVTARTFSTPASSMARAKPADGSAGLIACPTHNAALGKVSLIAFLFHQNAGRAPLFKGPPAVGVVGEPGTLADLSKFAYPLAGPGRLEMRHQTVMPSSVQKDWSRTDPKSHRA